MTKRANEILKKMTIEEKASLCSGHDFWTTKSVEKLGVNSHMVCDGPHGLRKQSGTSDHLGLNKAVEATCFPSAVGTSSSWDKELMYDTGATIATECQVEDVAVLLGPGANIKRSPLCGRNFEYISEDPFLSSQIASSHIKGVQSKGIGTSLKHFAINNQEARRFSSSSNVDERTAREIYLASFETAVKEAKPWTIMCSYNRINGVYASEDKWLLTDILRDEWGYEGLIVTDWGACNDRVEGVKAGQDLQMPADGGKNDAKIVAAVKDGSLDESALDIVATRMIEFALKCDDNVNDVTSFDKEAHHQKARIAAAESMVLLKNTDNVLPVAGKSKVAVIGQLAQTPRYQGGGSSHINPTKITSPVEGLSQVYDVSYSQGYVTKSNDTDAEMLAAAIETAKSNEVTFIFAGLPDSYESEGYDRDHMDMPPNQVELIKAVAKVSKKTVVLLANGSPITMPWLEDVDAVVACFLGGQAIGYAVADIVSGKINPCGKLSETYPLRLEDNPSFLNFPGDGDEVNYQEGIYVGYRYYDKKNMDVLFPFGYGQSYTSFEYTNIAVDKTEISDTDEVKVSVTVKNTGKVFGKEIVQLYVQDVVSTVSRPVKELKEFTKIALEAGEEKTVEFTLSKRAFAYYEVANKDWFVESGDFNILVGGSSRAEMISKTIKVNSTQSIKKVFTINSTIADVMTHPVGQQFVGKMMEASAGQDMGDMFDAESMMKMMQFMTLRMMGILGGAMTDEQMDQLLYGLNQ